MKFDMTAFRGIPFREILLAVAKDIIAMPSRIGSFISWPSETAKFNAFVDTQKVLAGDIKAGISPTKETEKPRAKVIDIFSRQGEPDYGTTFNFGKVIDFQAHKDALVEQPRELKKLRRKPKRPKDNCAGRQYKFNKGPDGPSAA